MALVIVAGPESSPVSVDEVKAHLRIDDDADDALLTTLRDAAVGRLDGPDGTLGRALLTQTWSLVLDRFPCGALYLPLSPFQDMGEIVYVDPDGVEQTLDEAEYYVDVASEPGRLVPVTAWPATKCQPGAVTVTFVAGYGDAASDVPAPIRAAVLGLVTDMAENRVSDTIGERSIPRWIGALLAPFKVWPRESV